MSGLGMVLGKFMPPHAGHVLLCEVAQRMCDELAIVVTSLPGEPIAGAVRVAWMRELFPRATVLHHTQVLPQEPTEHPAFWALWKASLRDVLPRAPVRVFTSDTYGDRLARELGADWIPIDPGRTLRPISASAIRAEPARHAAMLPSCVRAYYGLAADERAASPVVRVSVFGPESTGKSTLAAQLATELATTWVPEFARWYLESRGGVLAPQDLLVIAQAQAALEDALAPSATGVLVCDGDPLLTAVWADVLYAGSPITADVRVAARARRYDLTLLCDVDIPWVDDPVRYLPYDRTGFFARCEATLRAAEREYVVIRGTGEARVAAALAAIEGRGIP